MRQRERGHWNVVRALVELKADLDKVMPDNFTVLYHVAEQGSVMGVRPWGFSF